MTNKEEYKEFLKIYEMLEDKVEIFLELKYSPVGVIESMDFNNGEISVTTVNHSNCNCCSDEYEYFDINIEDIFKDLNILREEIRKEKEEKLEKKRIEIEKKRIKEEEAKKAKEYKKYIELKNQFEDK